MDHQPEVYNMPSVNGNVFFGAANGEQNGQYGTQSVWGLSPNGDAAMNSFWDDMMWDTFPEMPDASGVNGVVPGLDQFDWLPMGGQAANPDFAGGQDWTAWNYHEQQR